jgi:hypothetical protein
MWRGSYLYHYRHDEISAAYLEKLRSPELLNVLAPDFDTSPPTSDEQSVALTFALSYNKLDADEPSDALARRLLACAAWFAPGAPIPRRLLLLAGEIDPEDSAARRQAAGALARLAALGLIEVEQDGALRLHRLLAHFVAGGGCRHDPGVARGGGAAGRSTSHQQRRRAGAVAGVARAFAPYN